MSRISSFLHTCKSQLKEPIGSHFHVVLGNQACDADSMISSLCYAYMHNKHSSECTDKPCLPVSAISRRDLSFRREVKLLLDTVSVDLNDVICSEEVPFKTLQNSENFKITLVDHNVLDSKYDMLSNSVTEILDHHVDGGKYMWVSGDKRNIAFDHQMSKASVGSTCTLVAERFIEVLHMEPDIATLLLGTIALDTINMDSHAGIGTTRDANILEKLSQISSHSKDELFELLRNAKLDPIFWHELTVSDVLRIDYKNFTTSTMKLHHFSNIGIASILQKSSSFLLKSNIKETIDNTMKEENLSILIIMSFIHTPQPKRELILFCQDTELFNKLTSFLLTNTSHGLDFALLEEENNTLIDILSSSNSNNNKETILLQHQQCQQQREEERDRKHTHSIVLGQGNVRASRKQVAPILQAFIDSLLLNPAAPSSY